MTSSIIQSNADVYAYQKLLVQMSTNVKDDQQGIFVWLMFFDGFCFFSPCIFEILLNLPWNFWEISDIQDGRRQMAAL